MSELLPAESAILLLEDGTTFRGRPLGRRGTTTGEVCFNTGMAGYQEIFTDPSYCGQIVVTTTSHIGNYGVTGAEVESGRVQIAGLVCREVSEFFSRREADSSVQDYFEQAGIVGIGGVDTRALVRHVREKGAMNAIISSEELDETKLLKQLRAVPSMNGLALAARVSVTEAYEMQPPDGVATRFRVAVLDLGVKQNILRHLTQRGCAVRVFPYDTPLARMEEWAPDGYFISNGPGDPAATTEAIASVRGIVVSRKPLFGICLGHQMLALAHDVPTYKMPNGHRGLNHPVKNLLTGRCEITSQNHGFVVDAAAVAAHPELEVTHLNLNDQTVEGLRRRDGRAFSVQYHPESSPGPHDSHYLFDEFLMLLEKEAAP
ncbi:MAG: glutamine-hydrolyzing carbamoyl-phosphate synthase small subunit [Hymenobacteraceae bacterium]|nr:glutamine-hydrolyzing carbamoyl-phosphate synthase small subunit [Hymenobacteraceae bacterium]